MATSLAVNLGRGDPLFRQAIQVHEGFVRGDGTWQDVREIAVTMMNKGRALMLLGIANGPKKRKDLAELVNLRAHILSKLGRTSEAQECFRKAERLKGKAD
jgi:hypothetical protein